MSEPVTAGSRVQARRERRDVDHQREGAWSRSRYGSHPRPLRRRARRAPGRDRGIQRRPGTTAITAEQAEARGWARRVVDRAREVLSPTPPVDRSKTTLTDGSPVTPNHRDIDPRDVERAREIVEQICAEYLTEGLAPIHHGAARELREKFATALAAARAEGAREEVEQAVGRVTALYNSPEPWTFLNIAAAIRRRGEVGLPPSMVDPGHYRYPTLRRLPGPGGLTSPEIPDPATNLPDGAATLSRRHGERMPHDGGHVLGSPGLVIGRLERVQDAGVIHRTTVRLQDVGQPLGESQLPTRGLSRKRALQHPFPQLVQTLG
jgi:hypothetical protein